MLEPTPDGGVDADELAAALYQHHPSVFEREREAVAAQLLSLGDELGAARIRRLPTPSVPAWWVNQLATRWPEELEAVLELGRALRDAADQRDPALLTQLDRTRRVRTDALLSLLWHHGAQVECDPTRPGGQHVEPSPDDLTLVLETVTAAVLDDEIAVLLRSGSIAETVEAPALDLLRREAPEPCPSPRVPRESARRANGTSSALAVASAAVVDAENRLAAARDTVASLTAMLDGLEQELADLARDRDSTQARLESWRRTAYDAERELKVARNRLDRLT